MFSKKSNSQTKRLFSFIITCFFKNINTIQSFREIKLRKRLILRDFYHTHQDFIVAYQKNLDHDSEYCSSNTTFTSIISSQFFRKFILDSSNDTNLFDLKTRESSLNSFKQSLQSFQSSSISISMLSFHHVRRKHQNDFFIRNNATERFFRVSNMTRKNEKSADFYESLTLRRDRERRAIRVNQFSRNHLDFNRFCHFREVSQDQNKQFQNRDDHEKSIEMQRQKAFEERNQREKRVKNSEELVQFVRIKNVKRFVDQALKHHFRQQSRRHELRLTIQDDDAEYSKSDYLRVDQ